MINFTVGPVQSSDAVRAIGAEQVPYFRTAEFSELMFENERLIKKFAKASEDSRVAFITGSGSAGMETAIMNTLTPKDKAIVVNGGSFGHRFVELCELHEIPFTEIKLQSGKALQAEHLKEFENKGYTTFIVNKHETSTGVHYDMQLISDFCKRNNLFLIVDCISTFLADPFDMEALGADVMITGSQKALACPPGISVMVLSPKALNRIENTKCCCQYLDLKIALKNAERGQTPWTPAVSILRQIHARLKEIDANGGVEAEIARTASLANYFRSKLAELNLPLEIASESLSNAVTPLHPLNASAYDIFLKLKDEYGIWICPNGGDLKDSIFRVGHIGYLKTEDYDKLLDALADLKKKHFFKEKKVLTVGVFDLLHTAHISLFKRAKALGDYLIVAVQESSVVKKYKPNANLVYSTEERMLMVESIKYVDEVITYKAVDDIVKQVDYDILATGLDQNHSGFQNAIQWTKEHGKESVILARTEGISTSWLKDQIKSNK